MKQKKEIMVNDSESWFFHWTSDSPKNQHLLLCFFSPHWFVLFVSMFVVLPYESVDISSQQTGSHKLILSVQHKTDGKPK